MKKLLSMLLILGMLASLALPCTVANAQTNRAVTFTVNSVQGEVGEVIPVTISMTEKSEIGVLTLVLTVPTTYLSYTTVLDNKGEPTHWTSGEAVDDAGAMIAASNELKTLPNNDKGIYISSASESGYWIAGNLITLYFEIIKPLPLEGVILDCQATEVLSYEFEDTYTVTVVDGLVTSASATVIDMINKLPSFITLADEAQVVAADNAYSVLTDVQKNAVTNLSKLQDAQATIAALKAQAFVVENKIKALNVQSLEDEADVVAARDAYDDLSDEQKALVTNLDKLVAAEKKIKDLKEEAAAIEADKAAAKVVSDQIAALRVDSLDDKADVQAARTAYNNLTDAQKAYVSNLDVLKAAEDKIKDYQFAQGVIDMIDDLPANITLMDEDVVVDAREAYNGLTATQKGYVTNLSKLVSAELKIADLKAAQAVIDQIYGLPIPLALSNEADVIAARTAYDNLSDEQKAFVSNLETLVNAEKEIARLKALAEQEAADKAAAKVVADQIDALNVQSLDDEADVVAARNAYKALTDAQKAYVTNLAKLQAAEAKIAELKLAQEQQDAADLAAAKAVVDKIADLKVDSIDDEDDVVAAREAYEALTDTQKGLVTNLSKLEDAESDITRLKAEAEAKIEADKAAAKTVSDLIDALPENIVLTDESAVKMVRTAYDNLTDDQKAYVTNLAKLEDAEDKIAELKAQAEQEAADRAAAKQVDDIIDALDVKSLDDEPAVVAAREAYEALTGPQKGYVTKLEKLEAAEQTISDLKNVPPVVITYGDVDGDGNVTAADALEVLKSVVGKTSLTDDQKLAADVTGDGKVEAADALDILKKVVGKIEKFAVEE